MGNQPKQSEAKQIEEVQHPQLVSDFRVHIAIDFGTHGTALAYTIGDKVYRHEEWTNNKYNTDVKPKSDILLDENNQPIAFGNDAIRKFVNFSTFRYFKLL